MGENLVSGEKLNSPEGNFSGNLKKPAIAGLVILTPLVANFFVVKWFVGFFKSIPGDKFFYLTSFPLLNQFFKISSLTALTGATILLTGKIMSTSKGLKFEQRLDSLFTHLPVVGSVYSVTKTATDTVLRKRDEFQHPVKLSYQGMTFTAFQTGKSSEEGKRTVFVPTSPNITSGFVVEVDADQVEESDESIEQALGRVLSAGFSN